MKKNTFNQLKEGICRDCKKTRPLTSHSLNGGHTKPFILICEECHEKRHDVGHHKTQINKKIQKGTHYGKHKK